MKTKEFLPICSKSSGVRESEIIVAEMLDPTLLCEAEDLDFAEVTKRVLLFCVESLRGIECTSNRQRQIGDGSGARTHTGTRARTHYLLLYHFTLT